MGAKTYHGSCACGKVDFEVMLDLDQGTFKCNCTMCTKARLWGAAVKPDAFKLLSGEDHLTTFERGVEHRFCEHCGIKPFSRGETQDGKFVVINLGALDDLDPEDWARAPVQYMDGRNDNWSEEPAFTSHM